MHKLTDEQLLALLREALDTGTAPERVTMAARAAYGWRDLDAQLAELTYDSQRDGANLVGVRAASVDDRALTFEASDVLIELQSSGGNGHLTGQIVPGQDATIEVRYAGGSLTVSTSTAGRFWLTSVPHGPVSLHVELADGTVVRTRSVLL